MKKFLLMLVVVVFAMSCKKETPKESQEPIPAVKKDTVVEVKVAKPKAPELIYTVQIGAFRNTNNNLSKVPNVQIANEANLNKYRIGTFRTYSEARKFRRQALNRYPDAFVQALYNGQPISITKALATK